MSEHSWQIIRSFWNAGGTIKALSDYVFIIVLLSTPFIWILGLKKLLKIKYISLLLYPLNLYNRYIINKYGSDSSRIVLRNIKSGQKIIEEIKDQLDSIKPEKNKESSNIRAEINKTINNINKS
ncbi:MAG: hypothetical protein E7012_01585 [Alphaproteobacteria bacterium]|nr:hypothetical protein [Alphaproteobacteria bacterium]